MCFKVALILVTSKGGEGGGVMHLQRKLKGDAIKNAHDTIMVSVHGFIF